MADLAKCWTCEQRGPRQLGAHRWGCRWTSTAQGNRPSGCQSWSSCFWSCHPESGRGIVYYPNRLER